MARDLLFRVDSWRLDLLIRIRRLVLLEQFFLTLDRYSSSCLLVFEYILCTRVEKVILIHQVVVPAANSSLQWVQVLEVSQIIILEFVF